MLQARRNAIVYDHDGAQIRVFGGSQRGRRSFVHETSSVARKYPFLFEPAPDAGHAARSADHVRVTDGGAALKPISPSGGTGMSRAPTVDDPPAEAWLPERWRILPSASDCIRSERRSLTGVRLSAIARRQMRAIVEDQPTVESGGIGWGHSRSSLVEVLAATPPGPKSVHGPRRFRPDVLHDLSMVDQMSTQGLRPVCLFHSHVLHGESIASVADLHSWSSWRRALRMDQLLGPGPGPSPRWLGARGQRHSSFGQQGRCRARSGLTPWNAAEPDPAEEAESGPDDDPLRLTILPAASAVSLGHSDTLWRHSRAYAAHLPPETAQDGPGSENADTVLRVLRLPPRALLPLLSRMPSHSCPDCGAVLDSVVEFVQHKQSHRRAVSPRIVSTLKPCQRCREIVPAQAWLQHQRACFDRQSDRRRHSSSAAWKALRTQIIARDSGQCTAVVDGQRCQETEGLQVAHIAGDWHNEDPAGLTSLCQPCHARFDAARS
jgi:hypothetical protein